MTLDWTSHSIAMHVYTTFSPNRHYLIILLHPIKLPGNLPHTFTLFNNKMSSATYIPREPVALFQKVVPFIVPLPITQ